MFIIKWMYLWTVMIAFTLQVYLTSTGALFIRLKRMPVFLFIFK